MYKHWVKGKLALPILILTALLAIIGLILVFQTSHKTKYPVYQKQLEAANLMLKAEKIIYETKVKKGLSLDSNLDPNMTGLIGGEFTPLTTTLGDLKAKRTSTNPDFAALLIRYFNELDLKAGDTIAIGASGSFPGLIIAVLSAAEIMELKPIIIYSLGASMYGANLVEYTFIDMLNVLRKNQLIKTNLSAISLGGNNDRAENLLLEDSRKLFFQLAEESELPLIYEDNLEESIERRMEIYQANSEKPIKCFINIGGASANFGNSAASVNFSNGLTLPHNLKKEYDNIGLIFRFLKKDIPVIHLLNLEDLAIKNGVTVDPVPLPKPGKANVYFQVQYNNYIITFLIFILIIIPLYFLIAKK